MIPLRLILTRIMTERGLGTDHQLESEVWVCPMDVKTITPVTDPKQHGVDRRCRAVVKYLAPGEGIKLYYVEDDPLTVARARWRSLNGHPPGEPDFSPIPDGM